MHKKILNTKTLIAFSIFVAVSLIFVGRMYSNSDTSGTVSSLSPHNTSAASIRGAVDKERAPDMTLSKLDGGTLKLSDFREKKPVVLDFWASWCPNCRRDMPNLNRFYEKYKDDVEVIGVNLREKESIIRDFVASRGIDFPIVLDPFGQAPGVFGIRYTNTHILIDKDGNIVSVIPGDIAESDIIALIQNNS